MEKLIYRTRSQVRREKEAKIKEIIGCIVMFIFGFTILVILYVGWREFEAQLWNEYEQEIESWRYA